MQEFLLGVLSSYETNGSTELATAKLKDYLTAKYGTMADAKSALGDLKSVRSAYFSIQRDLYRL